MPSNECETIQRIGLVTILYNSESGLSSFLDCLQQQVRVNWTLYVIDNASPDGSASLVSGRHDPRIVLLRNSINVGFSRAANQGLRAAMAAGDDFVALMNNDTSFSQDFLASFCEARKSLRADVIAPRIMQVSEPEKIWYAGGKFKDEWVFALSMNEYEADFNMPPVEVEFATGCCLGISRRAIEKIGLLDERFFVYWEDTDFCFRLKKAGVAVYYVSSLVLFHDGGSSSGGEFSPSYVRLFYKSYIQFIRKHFGFRRAVATMLRMWRLERGRSKYDQNSLSILTRAMIAGLGTR